MTKKTRIEMVAVLFLLVTCSLWVPLSVAQDYPKGPIQIVIPFAPGGATDIFFRTLGDSFSKSLNVPISFVNKTGGGGIVGMSSVVNAKPDGYTLCAGNSDTLDITPLFTPDIPFDPIQ
jgi:tripartite-type tricarboxylate transporter receptor subunit TctC